MDDVLDDAAAVAVASSPELVAVGRRLVAVDATERMVDARPEAAEVVRLTVPKEFVEAELLDAVILEALTGAAGMGATRMAAQYMRTKK